MSITLAVWIGTVLVAVAIVLTHLRLSARGDGGGRSKVSGPLVRTHLVAGSLSWLLWVAFLLAPTDSWLGGSVVGIVAIGGWWVTAWIGIAILMRWLPSKGRHAPAATADSWSRGPALSFLAHGGVFVAVLVFTYAYLTSAV